MLLRLVAMSSSETLLLLLAMNFAHIVLHPLLLFLTTSMQDMLMLMLDFEMESHFSLFFCKSHCQFILQNFWLLSSTFFQWKSQFLNFSSLTFNMTDTNERLLVEDMPVTVAKKPSRDLGKDYSDDLDFDETMFDYMD